MPALYSQMPRPFWQAFQPPLPSHWFIFNALHKPMAVQLHCVIKKGFSIGEKGLRMQYSFHISGNRGYISNRVRYCYYYYIYNLLQINCY